MPLTTWIVQNTLAAACLALVVAAVCRWGRFSPALRHGLWLVVLIKLVTPPLVHIPVPMPQWVLMQVPSALANGNALESAGSFGNAELFAPDVASHEDAVLPITPPPIAGLPGEMNDDAAMLFAAEDTGSNSGLEQPVAERLDTESASGGVPLATTVDSDSVTPDRWAHTTRMAGEWWNRTSPIVWLVWGWCAGTAVFVLIQARRIINLRRLIASGRPGVGALGELVAQVAGEMEVPPPPVRIVPRLPSPALCAWGRVSLLWPEGPFDRLSPAGRRAVVLHELAHLKRRDHWTGWLELLAGCGWWWNPLFWYVRHQLHENAELACDAWVVAWLPDGRRAYAEALIDVAQGEPFLQLTGVVLGVGDGSRKLLERRLVMIMRGGVRYQIPVLGLAAIALVAVATLPRWSIAHSPGKTFHNSARDIAADNTVVEIAVDRRDGEQAGLIELEADRTLIWTDAAGAAAVDESQRTAAPAPFLLGAVPDPAETEPAATDPSEIDPFEKKTEPPAARSDLDANEKADVFVFESQNPVAGATFNVGYVSGPASEKESASAEDEASRLGRLEAQLGTLLNEVRELKKARPAERHAAPRTAAAVGAGVIMAVPPVVPQAPHAIASPVPGGTPGAGTFMVQRDGVGFTIIGTGGSAVETVTMTRTTYVLPKGRAESLAKSLAGQLNDDVEIKVKGDALQVTASNEDQQAIARLILLIQRKGRTSATTIPSSDQSSRITY